jgi:hypothetical protein
VRHGDHFIGRNTEIFALHTRCGDELRGRDVGGRNAFFFKIRDIVRTARDTRSSRAHRFNYAVAA